MLLVCDRVVETEGGEMKRRGEARQLIKIRRLESGVLKTDSG
jgi:hypothetical protein